MNAWLMITGMQPIPAPGWFPSQPGIERWWDGQQWTGHVRPIHVAQPWQPPRPADPTRLVTKSPKRTSHGFHLLMTLLTFLRDVGAVRVAARCDLEQHQAGQERHSYPVTPKPPLTQP